MLLVFMGSRAILKVSQRTTKTHTRGHLFEYEYLRECISKVQVHFAVANILSVLWYGFMPCGPRAHAYISHKREFDTFNHSATAALFCVQSDMTSVFVYMVRLGKALEE